MGFFDALKAIGRAWGGVERGASRARMSAYGWTPERIAQERDRLALYLHEQELQRQREAERFEWSRKAEERAAEDQAAQREEETTRRAKEEAQRRADVLDVLKRVTSVDPKTQKATIGYFSPALIEGIDPSIVEDLKRHAAGVAETEWATSQAKLEAQRAEEIRRAAEDEERAFRMHKRTREYDIANPLPTRERQPKPAPGPDAELGRAISVILGNPESRLTLLVKGPDGKLAIDQKRLIEKAKELAVEMHAAKVALRPSSATTSGNTEEEVDDLGLDRLRQYGITPEAMASLDAEDRAAVLDALASGDTEALRALAAGLR